MKTTLLTACVIIALSIGASAAVVVTTDSVASEAQTVYNPQISSTDLLQTSLLSVDSTGNFTQEGTAGIPALYDGGFGLGRDVGTATTGDGRVLTFNLDLAASPTGYTIGSINTYGGWSDGGRDAQGYTVFYSTASAPTTFTLLATAPVFNPAVANSRPGNRISISDDAGNLATNVAAVRFTYSNIENGYTGTKEIDIIAVPEPSTTSAFVLGSFAIAGLYFRRRQALAS